MVLKLNSGEPQNSKKAEPFEKPDDDEYSASQLVNILNSEEVEKDKEEEGEEEEGTPNTPNFLCLCSLVNTILEIYEEKYLQKLFSILFGIFGAIQKCIFFNFGLISDARLGRAPNEGHRS